MNEQAKGGEGIELAQRDVGTTYALVTSGRKTDGDSIASDGSEVAIMVKKTVHLQYENSE